MPDTADLHAFVKPYVYETLDTRAMHFSSTHLCCENKASAEL